MNNISKPRIPQTDFWSRIGLDRNKAIAIASLSLILVVVVVVQFGGSAKPSSTAETRKTALEKTTTAKTTTAKTATEKTTEAAALKPSGGSQIRRKLEKANRRIENSVRETKSKIRSLVAQKTPQKDVQANLGSREIVDTTTSQEKKVWPKVDVEKLKLEHPFGPPADLERMKKEKAERVRQEELAKARRAKEIAELEKAARMQQAIRNFQQQGVRLVYIKDNSRVAQIGARVVKQGDVIDGIQIVEIKENGSIVFEVVEAFFESK